jgi:hypothetical protein
MWSVIHSSPNDRTAFAEASAILCDMTFDKSAGGRGAAYVKGG